MDQDVTHPAGSICHPSIRLHSGGTGPGSDYVMTKDQVKAVLARVPTWPEDRQQELAGLAFEMEAELTGAAYQATRDELAAIDEGLVGEVASEEEVKEAFATPRKTVILDVEGEVDDEDLIQREDMVVTFSHAGYVKRVPLVTYRAQRQIGRAHV